MKKSKIWLMILFLGFLLGASNRAAAGGYWISPVRTKTIPNCTVILRPVYPVVKREIRYIPIVVPKNTARYSIKRGDNLFGIAESFHTSIPVLMALNPFIKNPNVIWAGDMIKVPGPSVKAEESKSPTGNNKAEENKELVEANKELKSRLEIAKSKIKELEEKDSGLSANYKVLNQKYETVQASVQTYENQKIPELKNEIKKIQTVFDGAQWNKNIAYMIAAILFVLLIISLISNFVQWRRCRIINITPGPLP